MAEGNELDHSVFAKYRDTPFLFGVAGQSAVSVRLQLIEIRDLTSPAPAGAGPVEDGREASPTSFSLLFRGPAETPLAQGTYPVEHAEMGSFLLFIVPVARDGGGVSYEAIFNRT